MTRDGTIVANGTANNPIIMTTAAVDNNGPLGAGPPDNVADDDDGNGFRDAWTLGDVFLDDTPTTAPLAPLNAAGGQNVALWGGLVVLGNASTNLSDPCGTGQGTCTVEGLTVPGFPVADCHLRRHRRCRQLGQPLLHLGATRGRRDRQQQRAERRHAGGRRHGHGFPPHRGLRQLRRRDRVVRGNRERRSPQRGLRRRRQLRRRSGLPGNEPVPLDDHGLLQPAGTAAPTVPSPATRGASGTATTGTSRR